VFSETLELCEPLTSAQIQQLVRVVFRDCNDVWNTSIRC